MGSGGFTKEDLADAWSEVMGGGGSGGVPPGNPRRAAQAAAAAEDKNKTKEFNRRLIIARNTTKEMVKQWDYTQKTIDSWKRFAKSKESKTAQIQWVQTGKKSMFEIDEMMPKKGGKGGLGAGVVAGGVAAGMVILALALKKMAANSQIVNKVGDTLNKLLGFLIDVILMPFLPIIMVGLMGLADAIMTLYSWYDLHWVPEEQKKFIADTPQGKAFETQQIAINQAQWNAFWKDLQTGWDTGIANIMLSWNAGVANIGKWWDDLMHQLRSAFESLIDGVTAYLVAGWNHLMDLVPFDLGKGLKMSPPINQYGGVGLEQYGPAPNKNAGSTTYTYTSANTVNVNYPAGALDIIAKEGETSFLW